MKNVTAQGLITGWLGLALMKEDRGLEARLLKLEEHVEERLKDVKGERVPASLIVLMSNEFDSIMQDYGAAVCRRVDTLRHNNKRTDYRQALIKDPS